MDRATEQPGLLERIRSSGSRVVVLAGPAACGKTAAVLAMAARSGSGDGPPRCLLLAPNAPTVAQLTRRILADSSESVALSPQVMTFAALAGRLMADCPPPDGRRPRRLSPLGRRLALRRIIDDLSAAGKVPAFEAVADTPGLVSIVDTAIAELKRAAIEPDALARVAGAKGSAAALLAVYRRYQQYLHEANSYDVEGQMWLARDALARAAAAKQPPETLAHVDAIAVDGFTDFTPTQLEMLRLASGGVDRMVITLPLGWDGRERLWRWTQRTLASIRQAFGDEVDVIAIDPPARTGAGVLWERLFDHDAAAVARPDEVEVVAAAGIEQEVTAAAGRIKRLLADGLPAGRAAVLVRSAREYRPTIDRIFAACDIPTSPAARPITEVPVVRFALASARLAPQFAAPDVLAVVGNSYFRPQALGDFDATTVAAAQLLIRQGGVLAGRDAYSVAAERVIRRADNADDEPDDGDDAPVAPGELLRRPQAVKRAADMLAALFDATKRDLLDLIGTLQLREAACDQDDVGRIARDLRAIDALESALAELPDRPAPEHLHEALSAATCPPARTESLVDVLDILDARALRYDHVFLLGLTEGQFPRRFVDNALLSERHRRRWADDGVLLDARDDLTAREMLLFYLAVARTDGSLTLGVLDSDTAGKATAPSAFVTSLLAPAGGLDGAVTERIVPGRLVGPPERLSCPGEAMSAAFAGLFADDGKPAPGAVNWALAGAGDAMTLAARGLIAEMSRWQVGEAGRFDGRITDPTLLAALADRYPDKVVFSASRLECFARCPWMYFAKYVLELPEPAPPVSGMEAARRGALCHEALYYLMTNLADSHGLPVRLAEIEAEQLAVAADDALATAARRDEARRPPAYPILRQVQLDQLAEQLRQYVRIQRTAASQVNAECAHFELAFGMSDRPDELIDPASRAEPVTLDCPAGPIRLRGKIDRVDFVQAGAASGLLVVDYKTGVLPAYKNIAAGLNVQIPLYAAAAAELLGRQALGGAYHRVGGKCPTRLFAVYKIFRGGVSPNNAYMDETAQVLQHVGRYVTAMAAGRFDMPAEVDCPSWCAFTQICQHSKPRAMVRAIGEGGHE